MLNALKERLADILLVREVRALRLELSAMRQTFEEMRDLLARLAPPAPTPTATQAGDVEVTYANDAITQEMMDIELRLTAARGMPPTEDEMLEEWERRRQGSAGGA